MGNEKKPFTNSRISIKMNRIIRSNFGPNTTDGTGNGLQTEEEKECGTRKGGVGTKKLEMT